MAVSLTVLVALVSAGCGSRAAATGSPSLEKTNLTIATVPTASSAGLYVAQHDESFRQAGLNVRIVNVGSGAGVTTSLLNGSIDVLNEAYAGFIEAQVHGAGRFHILADGYAGAPSVDEIVVLPGSGITSPQQLIGRTIAVNALDSIAALLVSSALESQGVPRSQVHLVAMPFPAHGRKRAAHVHDDQQAGRRDHGSGDFPTRVSAVHLQRVPDLMQSFGQLKQRFKIASMTNPVGS